MSPEFRIRPYRLGDEASINEGFQSVFGATRALDEWHHKFHPVGQRSRIMVGVDADETVIAHYAAGVERVQVGGRVLRAGQPVDVYSRRLAGAVFGRLYVRTVRAFFDRYGRAEELPLLYGFPGGRALKLGRLRLEYGTPIPLGFLRRSVSRRPPGGPPGFRVGGHVPEHFHPLELDELWEASKGRYPTSVVRDLGWWVGRYFQRGEGRYPAVAVGADGRLAAFALTSPAPGTLKLVDLLWDGRDPGALAALDAALQARAWGAGQGTLEAWLGGDPEARAALEGLGWRALPEPNELHISARSFREDVDGDAFARDFYYTWGDSDLV